MRSRADIQDRHVLTVENAIFRNAVRVCRVYTDLLEQAVERCVIRAFIAAVEYCTGRDRQFCHALREQITKRALHAAGKGQRKRFREVAERNGEYFRHALRDDHIPAGADIFFQNTVFDDEIA